MDCCFAVQIGTRLATHARTIPSAPQKTIKATSKAMTQRSRLHVPDAPARPGDKPDFSYVRLSPAGAVPRPDVTASVADIEELSTSLVRVLDDNHSAIGPWNPHLEAAD